MHCLRTHRRAMACLSDRIFLQFRAEKAQNWRTFAARLLRSGVCELASMSVLSRHTSASAKLPAHPCLPLGIWMASTRDLLQSTIPEFSNDNDSPYLLALHALDKCMKLSRRRAADGAAIRLHAACMHAAGWRGCL